MKHKINIQFIAITALLVFLSFFFHEAAHYLMGTALGYEMILTLNTVTYVEGSEVSTIHEQLVSAAGPIFTIISAIVCFVFLKKKYHVYAYIILFIAFIQRFLAAAVSLMSANDEARISEALGIGLMTLPSLVSIGLLSLVVITVRKYKISLGYNLLNFFLISFFIAAIVLADQYIIKPMVYS